MPNLKCGPIPIRLDDGLDGKRGVNWKGITRTLTALLPGVKAVSLWPHLLPSKMPPLITFINENLIS